MKKRILLIVALLVLALPNLGRAAACKVMSITTSSTTTPSVAAQSDRTMLVIMNTGAQTIFCSMDAANTAPSTTAGIEITTGQLYTAPFAGSQYTVPKTFNGKITCVTSTSTSTAYVCTQ